MPWRPLPSSGSLWVRFPGLVGTIGRSDFLPSIPGGSLTRPPVPPLRCLFRSRRRPALPPTSLGLVSRVPDRHIEDGENRISRVPVRSSRCMPCSRQTPVGPERQATSALAILPSARDTASAPTNSEFRGSITRPASSLSTLRSVSYPTTTQDLLPGGGQPYPDGTRPAGSVWKVSDYLFPLPRALLGARRVDPGGYPPGPPTDPDVQISRIRLFRRMGSLRGGRPPRTRWSSQLSYPMQFREDTTEVQSPRFLPLHRLHALAPPSLLRVPVGSVPRTRRYYRALRLPAIHPGGLVDSPAGTALTLFVSFPPTASATSDEPGFGQPGSRPAY